VINFFVPERHQFKIVASMYVVHIYKYASYSISQSKSSSTTNVTVVYQYNKKLVNVPAVKPAISMPEVVCSADNNDVSMPALFYLSNHV